MKITRGKTPSKPAGAPAPASAPTLIKPPTAPASSRNKTRVLLTVLDGKIEWGKITPESRKQFEALFADPEFLKQFGLSQKSSDWDPDQVKHLYDGLGQMYQMLGKYVLALPPRAIEVLGFSAAEKDALAEPTAKMADEYSGEFVKKHQSLFVWAAIFAAINGAKIKAAITNANEERARSIPPRPGQRPRVVSASTPRPTPAPDPVPPASRAADPVPEIMPATPAPVREPLGESLEAAPIPIENLKIPDADVVSPL